MTLSVKAPYEIKSTERRYLELFLARFNRLAKNADPTEIELLREMASDVVPYDGKILINIVQQLPHLLDYKVGKPIYDAQLTHVLHDVISEAVYDLYVRERDANR